MFSALQDNEKITSTAWIIFLSIIPSELVRTGALLLGGTIVISHIVHAIRPRNLMEKLQMQLLCLEEKLKAAIDTGIMAQADANSTAQIERRFGRWTLIHVDHKILLNMLHFHQEFDTPFLSFTRGRLWRLGFYGRSRRSGRVSHVKFMSAFRTWKLWKGSLRYVGLILFFVQNVWLNMRRYIEQRWWRIDIICGGDWS